VAQTEGSDQTDEMSARFSQFVLMQSQNILFALGRLAGPEGATEPHFDLARILIDQLEMFQAKTKGNLSREESELLESALSSMRLAFVESVSAAGKQAPAEKSGETKPVAPDAPTPDKTGPKGDEDQGGKRFTKSYG